MTTRKTLTFSLASMGMLLLILDGKTAMESAAAGVDLCLRSVIPSLFPFLFLSALITDSLWGSRLPIPKTLTRQLGIPEGAEALLIPGFLGGYPAGARAIAQACRAGKLEKATAEHLLGFCSNAGPAFLFGITAGAFPSLWMVWCLWGIHILSAVITGLLDFHRSCGQTTLPAAESSASGQLRGTVGVMGAICGWVLLFRILLGFWDRWFFWLFPEAVQVLLWGILELSNGCCRLAEVASLPDRFVICSAMLAFGGVCVTMQTASVTEGLSLKPYLRGKLTQTAVSVVLSLALIRRGWLVFAGLTIALLLFLPLVKKRSSIPTLSGV